MANHEPSTASWNLENNLTIRWSTSADTEKIAELMGIVYRRGPDAPPNERVPDQVRLYMRGDFPWMTPTDFVIVEDTQKPGQPVVACGSLWRKKWAYDDIPFDVGQPETIATHPDYRHRGLVREIMHWLHERSNQEGHPVQMIAGIPNFYRQFGYEYALDIGGKRIARCSLIPKANEQSAKPYSLRAATVDDAPLIAKLFEQRHNQFPVRPVWTEDECRYAIRSWDEVENGRIDPLACGINDRLMMIIDESNSTCGYVQVATRRRGTDMEVYAVEVGSHANLYQVMPSLLNALMQVGEALPTTDTGQQPLRDIAFTLGRTHPVYDVLGKSLAPLYEPPYAWYVRVPDFPAFLRHVAPVLERRLASSPLVGHTGEVAISFYRGGIQLRFEQGKIVMIQTWKEAAYGSPSSAALPSNLFLQLLFGYRSLEELQTFFPDVRASDEAKLLLNTLFPKRYS
ncbi:MAG: GNAT family N-acetyltransferase [Chloroflexota bacterium]